MKNTYLLTTVFAYAAVLSGMAPASAVAVPVYSSFGPDDTFLTPGYTIGGDLQQEIAAGFVAGVNGSLSSIRLASWHREGENGYAIHLSADDSGSPGAILETFAGTAFGAPDSITTLTSLLTPGLSAGSRYWIVVAASATDAGGIWNFGALDLRGIAFRDGGDPAWLSIESTVPAFEVNVLDVATEVPEPATSGLVITSLLMMWAARRRGD